MDPVLDPPKPGYLTTAFWMTLAANGIALLVLFGVMRPDEVDNANEVVSRAIENVAALAVALGTIWKYIQGRSEVSKAKAVAQVEANKSPDAVAHNVANLLTTRFEMVPKASNNFATSTGPSRSMGLLLLPLLLVLGGSQLYAQDGVIDRANAAPLVAEWPQAKVVLIDEKGQPVPKPAAGPSKDHADHLKPPRKTDGPKEGGEPKAKAIFRRELSLRQRSRLGLETPKLVQALRDLKEEGEIDEETSYAEMAPMVYSRVSKASGSENFKEVGVDLMTIFAWLEKIMPFLLMLAELFGEEAAICLAHSWQLV